MVVYKCLLCKGNVVIGSRKRARLHVMERHKLRCEKKLKKGDEHYYSPITAALKAV